MQLRPNSELEQHNREVEALNKQYRKLVNRGDHEEARGISEYIRQKKAAFFKLEPKPRAKKPGFFKRFWLLIKRLSSNEK